MKPHSRLKILHVLGQRPDATGSGIYLQAMMREAAARGQCGMGILKFDMHIN